MSPLPPSQKNNQKNDHMIRILQVVSNMDRAGIETMLMNYYRHIDRNRIQFDFLCNKLKPGDYDEEIIRMGGRIFHTPGLNPFKYGAYLKYMDQLFREHPEYKIVHAHNDAFVVYSLYAAKRNHVPVRIAHVHCSAFGWDYKLPLKWVCRPLIKPIASHLWACGMVAGEFFYGKGTPFHVHNNAIEVNRYVYNEAARQRIRRMNNLGNGIVIGHIGRFVWQKNHRFLIDIFSHIYQLSPQAHLVLLGVGDGIQAIQAYVREKGLEHVVHFMHGVNNVNEWCSAFDCFIMPSLSEGMPVVGIEAQTADLPCIFSDSITREVDILPSTCFLSLKQSPEIWAEKALQLIREKGVRQDRSQEITQAGFNIEIETVKLMEMYERMYNLSR